MKKSLNIAFLGFLALGALAMFATPALATVSFIDGTFNDADWTAAKFIDTTAGASATFSAGQVATGGNPGSYRNTDMHLNLWSHRRKSFEQFVHLRSNDTRRCLNP